MGMSVYAVQATHPGANSHSFVGCTFYGVGAASPRWDPWKGHTLAQSAAAAAAAAAVATVAVAAPKTATLLLFPAVSPAARSPTMTAVARVTDGGGGDGGDGGDSGDGGDRGGDGDGDDDDDDDDDLACSEGPIELLFSCGSQVVLSACTMVGSPLLFAGGACNSRNASSFPVNATLLEVDDTTGATLCAVETRVAVTGQSSFDGLRLHGLVSTGGECAPLPPLPPPPLPLLLPAVERL